MATSIYRTPEARAERRRIAVALLVAIFLHLAVFLSSGPWRFGTFDDGTTTPAELRIELTQPDEAQEAALRGEPQEVEQLAAQVPQPAEEPEPPEVLLSDVAVEGIDERVADDEVLPPAEAVASNKSPAPLDSALAEAANEIVSHMLAAEPQLAEAAVSSSEPVLATIAPAQERALTRRLMREARSLIDTGATTRLVTFRDDDRQFSAEITRDMDADGTGLERITVDIVTEQGGERAHTSMQMKRLAFSHFTQLVDRWDPNVAVHDDEIAGRFHTNSQLIVAYDRKVAPRLLGKVSTSRGVRIEETDRQGRPRRHRRLFVGGLETGAARIRLPEISQLVAQAQATGKAHVHAIPAGSLIVFHGDGGYDCVDLGSRNETHHRLTDRPTYIVGARDTELRVRGVVNGNVTVYSPEIIVVQGALTYAQGARTDADDYLGLVSDGNIEIDTAAVTGPGDLAIHAAVYARRRFVVRNTNARSGGTLVMYGSVTAGSLSETEPRYATRLVFDPRFEHTRPPGFPETDRFEIDGWDRKWKIAEAPEL